MADTTLSASEQDAMLRDLGRILSSAILDEWDELQFFYAGVFDVSTMGMTVRRPDGSAQPITPPRRAARLMRELRAGMYQPGRGAWFTARYVVDGSGGYRVDFDYDNEPQLDFTLASTTYLTDLQHYPREAQHIPGWLRLQLDLASTGRMPNA